MKVKCGDTKDSRCRLGDCHPGQDANSASEYRDMSVLGFDRGEIKLQLFGEAFFLKANAEFGAQFYRFQPGVEVLPVCRGEVISSRERIVRAGIGIIVTGSS